MRNAKWAKPLSQADIDHLTDNGVKSLASAKRNFAAQKQMRDESDHSPVIEPCWECRAIAKKLGLPV